VRGLTQDGARQLIAIASEVKTTRRELIASFTAASAEMHEVVDGLKDAFQVFREELLGGFAAHVEETKTTVNQEASNRQKLGGQIEELAVSQANEHEARRKSVTSVESHVEQVDANVKELRTVTDRERARLRHALRQLKLQLAVVASCAAVGLGTTAYLLIR
jgi:hypothetical protein